MIIFQRMVTFQGPAQEVVPWAMDITETVNGATDLEVSLWQGRFGGPVGTLAWSTLADSLTALEAAFDALGSDAAYLDLETKAADWVTTPGEDSLLRMVHTTGGEYTRPAVGSYAEVTAATPSEGHFAEAGAWAVEIADMHARLTHSSVLVCTSGYGGFGEMRWLGLYDSAAAVDAGAEAIAKDEDYIAALDGGGGLFQEGSATRTLARRIA
ncbi:hypothetical protein [Actinospongicola halichondriae]|uniref:hypothetical protein n=1 Tax=Actinospongicola halichondriae TaxID=3236844 RepID=UPI003D532053